MSKKTESLEERKKRLETELESIQSDLEQSMGRLKGDVRSKMSVAYWAKKYPFQCIGAGVMLGFMIAGKKKSRNKKKTATESTKIEPREPGMLSVASSEIKQMLTRKATNWLVDKLDKFVENKLRKEESTEVEKPEIERPCD